jgi:hypothetical protein
MKRSRLTGMSKIKSFMAEHIHDVGVIAGFLLHPSEDRYPSVGDALEAKAQNEEMQRNLKPEDHLIQKGRTLSRRLQNGV